jgi:N-acetylmuramoyl-L-alanine amidase
VSSPEIQCNFLPYVAALQHRDLESIDLVVIHCTELPDLPTAREYGERILYPESQTGNSGHYYLDRSGQIEHWVPLDRVAHHVRGYNARSVGVELVNLGRYPHWHDSRHQQMTEPYPDDQISSLARLILLLRSRLPGLQGLAGHEDLDKGRVTATDDASRSVLRKRDPGPLFPWAQLIDATGLARVFEPEFRA